MAVLIVDGEGYIREHIRIEYEWKPPLCLECHVFGHSLEQCPKSVTQPVNVNMEVKEDGFTTISNRRKKGKSQVSNAARQIEGLKLNKPKSTFVYRQKQNQPTNKSDKEKLNVVKLENHFDALRDQDDLLKEVKVGETSSDNGIDGVSEKSNTSMHETSIDAVHFVICNRIIMHTFSLSALFPRRILFAASSYFVWIKRNNRLFKKIRRSSKEVQDIIMVTVRLKLISFRFKNTANVDHLLARWKMPNTFKINGN
ncbi:hypothetical protein Tco_0686400 [Tanacetum coccineum]